MKSFFVFLSLCVFLNADEIVCEDGEKACLAVVDTKTHKSIYLINSNNFPIWIQRAAVRINDQSVNIDGKTFKANSKIELVKEKKTYYVFDKTQEKTMHIVKWMYFGAAN